jgi:hypothetical protein
MRLCGMLIWRRFGVCEPFFMAVVCELFLGRVYQLQELKDHALRKTFLRKTDEANRHIILHN